MTRKNEHQDGKEFLFPKIFILTLKKNYHCFILDVTCPIGILECVNCFLSIRIRWTDTSYNRNLLRIGLVEALLGREKIFFIIGKD